MFDNEEPSKSAVASVLKSRGVKCFFLPVRCDQYNDAIGRAYHNENRFPFIALTDYHLAIGYNGKTIFIPIEKVVSFSLYAGENNGEYHKQDFTYYRKKSPVAGAIVGGAIGGSTGAVVGALAHNGTEQRTERSYWAKYTYHLEIAIEEDVFVFGGLIEHLDSTRKSLVRHSNSMTINKYLGVDSPEKVRSTFIQLKDKLATSGKHPIDLTAQKSGNSSLTGPQAFIVIVLFVLLILILCYLIVFVI